MESGEILGWLIAGGIFWVGTYGLLTVLEKRKADRRIAEMNRAAALQCVTPQDPRIEEYNKPAKLAGHPFADAVLITLPNGEKAWAASNESPSLSDRS